jgi:hypothetical protein
MIFTWRRHKNPLMAILAFFIRFFTGGGPEHVRLYMGNGKFTEFTYPESRWGDLSEIDMKYNRVEIGRNLLMWDLTDEEKENLRKWCKKQMGKPYDVYELVWEQLLDEIDLDSMDDSSSKSFVCSSYVGNAYKKAKRDFLPNEKLISPQDLREAADYLAVWRSWKK